MSPEYTKEDIKKFKKVCPSKMLFWLDENLALEMERRGWKPSVTAAPVPSNERKTISIDRSKLFDPVNFIEDKWVIYEEDKHSLALTEVNLANVRFEHMLKNGETQIKGREKFLRLKEAGYILLDAKILQTLWENQHLIPQSWKRKTNGDTSLIYFDGTVLQYASSGRYTLCLHWYHGQWSWVYNWFGNNWNANHPSAILIN